MQLNLTFLKVFARQSSCSVMPWQQSKLLNGMRTYTTLHQLAHSVATGTATAAIRFSKGLLEERGLKAPAKICRQDYHWFTIPHVPHRVA